MRALGATLALLCAADAAAQSADAGISLGATLQALKEENAQLKERVDGLDEKIAELTGLTGRVSGYLDLGFFAVQGDGSGLRTDIGNLAVPSLAGQLPDSWVFLGDPLATQINSRGDPADTGESRAVVFDGVNAGSRPTFLLNVLNLGLFAGLGSHLSLTGSVDFVPRGRNVSDAGGLFLGDFIDVRLAYAEYIVPLSSFSLSLFAGKFDSVLGLEYRTQDAPDRMGVSPSLLCRYVCGRPVGLKARAKFFDDALVANFSLTNGTHFVELFPFSDEVDSNWLKTVAGRLSYRFAVGSGAEIGLSGAIGPQDNQSDDSVVQWHYGVDLSVDWADVVASAEFVSGNAPGKTEPGGPLCGLAQCLRYRSAYVQLGYRLSNLFTPYVRVDWRDALHRSGASFVYVSKVGRVTAGVRVELGTHVIVKAEYVVNRELAPVPEFADDFFTSSLVVKY